MEKGPTEFRTQSNFGLALSSGSQPIHAFRKCTDYCRMNRSGSKLARTSLTFSRNKGGNLQLHLEDTS